MKTEEKKLGLTSVISRNEDILVTDLDGEMCMLNISKGKYYGLNTVGTRIWQLIEKPISIEKIVSTLMSEYTVDFNTCREQVIHFLEELVDEEIIKTAEQLNEN